MVNTRLLIALNEVAGNGTYLPVDLLKPELTRSPNLPLNLCYMPLQHYGAQSWTPKTSPAFCSS